GVRVHTDGRAAASARDVSANAYTVGHNVVFGAGRFAPETHEGRRLIAHELTHVVQQSRSYDTITDVDAGQPVQVQTAGAGIQCDPDEDARRIHRERMDGLRQRIALIDADLGAPSSKMLPSFYVDQRKIERTKLSNELATLQPATPEQAEAIVDPSGIQRRKQADYASHANLPKGLQEDLKKLGIAAPEKPPVFWTGGTTPPPALRAHVERVARKADEENISLKAASNQVQHEGAKPPSKVGSFGRQDLNRQMMAIGGKPAQDPNRKPTEWEKTEIEGVSGGKQNPSNWRPVYNPDTGDTVGYERESNGYYERRNTKGEVTHRRESPMTEDATYLTRPDRDLTPFERQHVFVEKEGRRTPDSYRYRPIYNKGTGQLVGYTYSPTTGITQTFNAEGVVVDEVELGLEASPIQADDLLGVGAVGKAVAGKVVGKVGQLVVRKAGAEGVEQGGKRLLAGAGKEVLEKVGEIELKQAGREGVQLGETVLKSEASTSSREAAELGGKEAVEAGTKQVSKAAPFTPAPAAVGDAAYKARMTRDVENVMRNNIRNTIGSGGEASAQASARTTVMDLNAIAPNFPQLDTVSRETVASVKAFGVDKPLSASVVGRYDKELQALRTVVEPGVPTKLGKAADLMATNRESIQAAGAWPNGLARNATPQQIGKFVNQQGVLAIPADHVGPVRDAIAAKARANPAAYGLTPGAGLDKGIERLTERVQSLGLTSEEIVTINKRVFGNP
ncbi:MAG: DUF4157 domain-containing protein, partial [Planctomycetales bacterium]|nr:DUF4157 domain-containing protein [Planctomycetales bacterium]